MRRGADFGAAVAKSQATAANSPTIVPGQARSFRRAASLYLPLIRRN
jgi:hypothetical protein